MLLVKGCALGTQWWEVTPPLSGGERTVMIAVVLLSLGEELIDISDWHLWDSHWTPLLGHCWNWQRPPSLWPVITVLETHGGSGVRRPWNGGFPVTGSPHSPLRGALTDGLGLRMVRYHPLVVQPKSLCHAQGGQTNLNEYWARELGFDNTLSCLALKTGAKESCVCLKYTSKNLT